MLSSICFMPASLTPQSLPPFTPSMASYFGDSTVTTCMRAGLYQTKNGLLVFLGSLRSRKSTTLAEISSSTVLERSSVSGPSSLQRLVLLRAVGGLARDDRARRRQADASFSDPPRRGPPGVRGPACSCTAARRPARSASC